MRGGIGPPLVQGDPSLALTAMCALRPVERHNRAWLRWDALNVARETGNLKPHAESTNPKTYPKQASRDTSVSIQHWFFYLGQDNIIQPVFRHFHYRRQKLALGTCLLQARSHHALDHLGRLPSGLKDREVRSYQPRCLGEGGGGHFGGMDTHCTASVWAIKTRTPRWHL